MASIICAFQNKHKRQTANIGIRPHKISTTSIGPVAVGDKAEKWLSALNVSDMATLLYAIHTHMHIVCAHFSVESGEDGKRQPAVDVDLRWSVIVRTKILRFDAAAATRPQHTRRAHTGTLIRFGSVCFCPVEIVFLEQERYKMKCFDS